MRLLGAAIAVALAACGDEDSAANVRKQVTPAGGASIPTATANEPWFEAVAATSGFDFVHQSARVRRFDFPEIMGGGVALLDFDGDGLLDIYCVQSGDLEAPASERPGNRLFKNLGAGRFEDVTARAGVGDRGYGMGAATGDYDGDGDTDLYVTNVGPNVLYRNNGDGTFTDVTREAGVGEPAWSASAAFSDVDGDGRLDLFVANYIAWTRATERECRSPIAGNPRDYCPPTAYRAPMRATFYRNVGEGRFEDQSERAGLGAAFGNGLGVVCGDFDGDRRIDVFVANDGLPNQLWIGAGDGTFTDHALLSGCSLDEAGQAGAGMGVQAIDWEADGDLDLFVTHLRGQMNTFYKNRGDRFDDATAAVGLAAPSRPFTGFGLAFADLDNDGDLDLYVANGRVTLEEPMHDRARPYAEPSSLYECADGKRFKLCEPAGGTRAPLVESSRALAAGDLDNDGAIDLVVINQDARAHLLRNVRAGRGAWIALWVKLESGADALGARVKLRAGGKEQVRLVETGYSYCAANDPRVHFGLGAAIRVDEVVVTWPGGKEERFGPFEAGRIETVRKGSGR